MIAAGSYYFDLSDGSRLTETNRIREAFSFLCPPFEKSSSNITSPTGELALPIVEDCLEAASISWNFIDKVIYINANEAIDRNDAMLRDFLPVFQKKKEDIEEGEGVLGRPQ